MRRPAIGMIIPLTQSWETSARIWCDHKAVQAISSAGGQVCLLPIERRDGEQEMLCALTEALEGIDGLLLADQTPDQTPGSSLLESAASLALQLQVPVLGIGDGASQIALASGGSLHAHRCERDRAAKEALPAHVELVLLDRSCFSRCLPQRYAERVRAEEEVLAVECLPQGRVKRLASPFCAWAWSCRDASIVAFGTPLETGSYAVGTSLPIQQEELRSTRFSHLLFVSFVQAARERGTRSQQINEEVEERTLGAGLAHVRASSTVHLTARLPLCAQGWGM